MNDTKPWYLSAGVWGAIVSLVASLLSLFKVELDPRLQGDLRDWMLALATLVASAVALYGRVRASRRIALARPSGAANNSADDAPASAASTAQTTAPAPGARPAPSQNWRMNHVLIGALLLSPLLAHCAGCRQLGTVLGPSPSATYVAADRATFEAVAPEYASYVHNDASLDEDERARRDRTVETWRLRIESAERGKRSDEATEPRSDEGEGSPSDEASEHGIDRVDE